MCLVDHNKAIKYCFLVWYFGVGVLWMALLLQKKDDKPKPVTVKAPLKTKVSLLDKDEPSKDALKKSRKL